MALILKTGLTFNPPMSEAMGVDLSSSEYYGVIDEVQYSKMERDCFFSVNVYGKKQARVDKGTIMDRINFSFNGDAFATTIGLNGLTVSQAYEIAKLKLTDWASDE